MEFLTKSYRASHLGNLMLAYDGKKSAFAAGPLPFESKEFAVKITEQNGTLHLGNLTLVYDGKKSAFAAGPLPFESKEFAVKITEQNGREREFKVNIKFAAKKDLHHLRQFLLGRQQHNPQETIQALDVVLRESASKTYHIFLYNLAANGAVLHKAFPANFLGYIDPPQMIQLPVVRYNKKIVFISLSASLESTT